MTHNRLAAIAAAIALTAAAGVAAAQGTTTVVTPNPAPAASNFVELDDVKVVVQPFGLTAEEIDGRDVIGASGDKIGEIEEVLVDSSGAVAAFVLETGGFLGLGERDVVVGIDQFQFDGERFATALDKETLQGLPTWDD